MFSVDPQSHGDLDNCPCVGLSLWCEYMVLYGIILVFMVPALTLPLLKCAHDHRPLVNLGDPVNTDGWRSSMSLDLCK